MSFYLFIDFNLSFTYNFFNWVGALFSVLNLLLYSTIFYLLDFASLFYNFWKLVLLFSTSNPVFYYKDSSLLFSYVYVLFLLVPFILLNLFVFLKVFLLLLNNDVYSKVNHFFKYILNTLQHLFNLSNLVFMFKILPDYNQCFKPFSLNNGGYTQILNINGIYVKSLLIKLKGFLTLHLTYFFNLFLTFSTFLFNLMRPLVWKPLFKKTSYFGIYNSFKNKY